MSLETEGRESPASSGDVATALTVALVDDHLALRKGIELLLEHEGCRVVGSAADATAAFELIRRCRPDVSVIDIALAHDSGVELTRRLLEHDPGLGIVLYTGLQDRHALLEGLNSGARGFAMKAGLPEELLRAIRLVAAGGDYLDPRLSPLLVKRGTPSAQRRLSVREADVLALLAEGLTGEQIAGQLVLSPETVRTHIRNAMVKLDARTRVHAIAMALRDGELIL